MIFSTTYFIPNTIQRTNNQNSNLLYFTTPSFLTIVIFNMDEEQTPRFFVKIIFKNANDVVKKSNLRATMFVNEDLYLSMISYHPFTIDTTLHILRPVLVPGKVLSNLHLLCLLKLLRLTLLQCSLVSRVDPLAAHFPMGDLESERHPTEWMMTFEMNSRI